MSKGNQNLTARELEKTKTKEYNYSNNNIP